MSTKPITPKAIDFKYRFQKGDTCVLLAYAFGASHFTSLNINKFFEAYCKHFDLKFTNTEETYNIDFNPPNLRWEHCRNGQNLILCLHENSIQSEFVKARQCFTAEYIESSQDKIQYITAKLKNGTLLSLTLNLLEKNSSGSFEPNNKTHTVLTGWSESEKKFFIIETTDFLYFRDRKEIDRSDSSQFVIEKHPRFDEIKPVIDGSCTCENNSIRFKGGDGLLLTAK